MQNQYELWLCQGICYSAPSMFEQSTVLRGSSRLWKKVHDLMSCGVALSKISEYLLFHHFLASQEVTLLCWNIRCTMRFCEYFCCDCPSILYTCHVCVLHLQLYLEGNSTKRTQFSSTREHFWGILQHEISSPYEEQSCLSTIKCLRWTNPTRDKIMMVWHRIYMVCDRDSTFAGSRVTLQKVQLHQVWNFHLAVHQAWGNPISPVKHLKVNGTSR